MPSGENCAAVDVAGIARAPRTSVLPLSTSTRRSLWSEPLHSSDFESGAQAMPLLSQSTSLIFFGFLPSSSEIQISSRPVRSETNAIHFPFGDQRGVLLSPRRFGHALRLAAIGGDGEDLAVRDDRRALVGGRKVEALRLRC